LWGLVWLVIDWWQKEVWILFIMTWVVGAAAVTSIFACTGALLKARQNNTVTPP
jgi:hypothetical protein